MSIEQEDALSRVATNLALIAGAISTLAEAVNGTYKGNPIYAQNRSAEPSVPPAAEVAAPKRGRGRPAKGEETASAPAVATTPATLAPATSGTEDPFAATTPATPTATLEEVRTALTELSKASSQQIALDVLKAAGGAPNLAGLTADKYGLVVQAAKAKQAEYTKAPAPAPEDPFAIPAAASAPVEISLDDVRGEIMKASKRTSQDTVAKVVMDLGGKAADPATGGFKPSWTALPKENYGKVIAAVQALPTTK